MPQTDCDSFVRYQAKEVLLMFMLKSEIHYLSFLEYALALVQMRISDPLQKKGMSQKAIHETPVCKYPQRQHIKCTVMPGLRVIDKRVSQSLSFLVKCDDR